VSYQVFQALGCAYEARTHEWRVYTLSIDGEDVRERECEMCGQIDQEGNFHRWVTLYHPGYARRLRS
jgi:hypothetical protein